MGSARGKQPSVYIHLHMCTLEGAWGSFDWNTFYCNISSGHGLRLRLVLLPWGMLL